MTDTPDVDPEGTRPRPRPTPRPRAGAARPSPRPRVAGSRRADDEPDTPTESVEGTPRRPSPAPRARTATPAPLPKNRPRPAPAATRTAPAGKPGRAGKAGTADTGKPRRSGRAGATSSAPRRGRTLALVLAALCVLAAAGGGWLLWQRQDPTSVDPAIFDAARTGVEDVYAYDYQDSDGSVQRKLDALTGDLRDQYESDLSAGGIIDTYEQVSATTSYDVLEVGLQQVNDSQDQATLVVFGQYVVQSVNSGTQAAPAGSECTVTDDGAQSCTQTVRVTVLEVDGDWKISELTLLTSS